MKKEREYPNLQFSNPSKMNDPFDCDKNLLDYSDIPDAMTHGWPKECIRDIEINDAHNKRYFAWICSLSKVNDELFEQYADMSDKAWNPIREKIVDEINTALYDWANAEPEKAEI